MHKAYSGKLVNGILKTLGYSTGHNRQVIYLTPLSNPTVISYYNYNQVYKRMGIPKDLSENQANKIISVFNITNDFILAMQTLED